jgi:hypothetical protein
MLGYPLNHPLRVQTRKAIDDLLIVESTALTASPASLRFGILHGPVSRCRRSAMSEARASKEAFDWLSEKQLLEPAQIGLLTASMSEAAVAFSVHKLTLPDLDDTAAVAYAMNKSGDRFYDIAVQRQPNGFAACSRKRRLCFV